MKIVDYPQIILCWTQEGCPACEAFVPVFSAVAAKYERCVPSMVVLADAHQGAADLYRVNETPTTMILRYGRRSLFALSGATEPAELEQFFQAAVAGCEL